MKKEYESKKLVLKISLLTLTIYYQNNHNDSLIIKVMKEQIFLNI
jgi:hypothetical protein